ALTGLLLGFKAQCLDALLQFAHPGDSIAFRGPTRAQSGNLLLERGQFALHFRHALAAVLVSLALQRSALDFERGGLAFELIDFGRYRADLNRQRSSGFVDEV